MLKETVRRTFLLFFIGTPVVGLAQIGGINSFELLNVPAAARLGGLGGVNVSLADRDVNFFLANPALNGDTLGGIGSVNYQFYVADIGHATVTYARDFKNIGVVSMAIQNINYGTIQGYDASGIPTYEFRPNETVLTIGKTHQIGVYRIGANIKGAFSSIDAYRSAAVAMDLGALFIHPQQQFTVGMAIRNLGFVVSDYTGNSKSKLPFDVQIGTTFKPQYMPLRFSVTGFNLTRPDVTYRDLSNTEESNSMLQMILTHINFATEVLLHKNVNVLVGYNYIHHQALKLDEGGGGAGLSVGFSANVRIYDFAFSRTTYVAGNAAYSFTLSANIRKLIKRQ